MTFKEVMDQVITWLQQDQRISGPGPRSANLPWEDDYLEDLEVELIEVKQVAVDQEGKMLVWRGDTAYPTHFGRPRDHPSKIHRHTPPPILRRRF